MGLMGQACEDHQQTRPDRPGEERMENLKGGLELLYLELSENSDATHRSEEQQ